MTSTGASEITPATETIVDLSSTINNGMDTTNSFKKVLQLPPPFLHNLERLNESRLKYWDVKLFEEKERKPGEVTPKVLANKMILSMNSPYFQAKFKKEKFSYHVPIPTAILEQLVVYMYTGQFPAPDDDNILEYFRASQLLELADVLRKCQEFIMNKLMLPNFDFEMLIINNCPPDQTSPIVQTIFANFEAFTTSENYCKLTLTQLEQLMNFRETLTPATDITSHKLLKGILNWALADPMERRQHFIPLLENMSLTDIPDELVACIVELNSACRSLEPCNRKELKRPIDNNLPAVNVSSAKKRRMEDLIPLVQPKLIKVEKVDEAVVPKVEDPDIFVSDGFEVGPDVEGITSSHPLMLFINEDMEEQKRIYSLMAYDFRERKSAVIIENVALDRYNYGMYLKGQTLNLVGGRNDSPDFLGSSGKECLSTILSFDKFLQVEGDKLRRIKYPKNGDPIYVSQCLKKPRSNFGTATYKSKFFAFGGHSLTLTPLRSLKTVEMFDNELNTWKLVESMSEHREHFGVATIHNSIYVAGGFKASNSPIVSNTVEEYLPDINTWKTAPSMLTNGIATRLVNVENVLFALHGCLQSSSERLNNYEIFDPRVGKWVPSRIPTRVNRFYRRGGAAACINGMIYSFGGYANLSGGTPIVELLDPRNEEWSIEGDLPRGGIFTSVSFMNL